MDTSESTETEPRNFAGLAEAAGEIKRKRGRPRKDGGSAPIKESPAKNPDINPLPKWNLELSKKLIQAEGFAWGGISGFGGFIYSPEDLDFLAPLGLEVFKELLPETQWTFIAAFFLGYAGIKGVQIRAFRQFQRENALRDSAHKVENPSTGENPPEKNAT